MAMKQSSCSGPRHRKRHMGTDLKNKDRRLGTVVGPKWQKIAVCLGWKNINFRGISSKKKSISTFKKNIVLPTPGFGACNVPPECVGS